MKHIGSYDAALLHDQKTERSHLLPFNRKLRHLQGITLRNLVLVPGEKRGRPRTFDDEALPFSLKSPAKLLSIKEQKVLGHSRSHSDLTVKNNASNGLRNSMQPTETVNTSSQRPGLGKTPRKSFMEPSIQGATSRQQKLDNAVLRHIADIFFTIHITGLQDPVYVSEVQTAMNPDFRFFDLSACSAAVTRLDTCTIKVWANYGAKLEWRYLIDFAAPLRYLQYIGKSIENFHHPLPDNCVIVHLADGVYTSFTDTSAEEPRHGSSSLHPLNGTNHTEFTSSYDALMRLSTLDTCIQDAIATREHLIIDINKLITSDNDRFTAAALLESKRDSLARIKRAIATERKNVRSTKTALFNRRESLASRRFAMANGRDTQRIETSHVTSADSKLSNCRNMLEKVADETVGQRRRVCEDLLAIYPIEPVPNSALQFTIRGLALPNSNFPTSLAGPAADGVAAALGHVAHVVYMLSFYLGVPLPYPVQPCSSISTARDPISLMATSTSSASSTATVIAGLTTSAVAGALVPARTFPLFTKNAGLFFRFEYAVFLLNKDIELICERLGLKVLDIRQTLPNLKYALFVATAGRGELPARKAGGIRGLLRGND